MIDVQECPLCGGHRKRLFETSFIHGAKVENWICTGCTLVFQSPRMDEEELAVYYAGAYRVEQQGTESPTENKIAFERERARFTASVLKRSVGAVGTHLDVGCAAGELLLAMRGESGCRMIGIEPSRAYREHGASLGIELFESLEQFTRESDAAGGIDLVTMSHVLEHMPDPIGTLRQIRRDVLAGHGHLYVEVPNLFVHTSFEPAHLFAFHARTLKEILAQGGFDTIRCFAHGRPRPDPRPHYLCIVARPASVARPLRVRRQASWVKLRRNFERSRLGLLIRHPRFVARTALQVAQRRLFARNQK
jgi:2-polyprenyl-3-methyl-5-hydroxy-6-metoxy-1,4-benzoquinol methylase